MKRFWRLLALLLLFLLLILIFWPRRTIPQHIWFEQFENYPLVISHADDSGQGLWPGNTMRFLEGVAEMGVDVLEGRIFGMTGLLLGLAALRKMDGFGLLAETLGTHPDIQASEKVLAFLKAYLGLQLDVKDVENVAKEAFQVGDLSDWTRKRIEDIEDVRFNPFFE